MWNTVDVVFYTQLLDKDANGQFWPFAELGMKKY